MAATGEFGLNPLCRNDNEMELGKQFSILHHDDIST